MTATDLLEFFTMNKQNETSTALTLEELESKVFSDERLQIWLWHFLFFKKHYPPQRETGAELIKQMMEILRHYPDTRAQALKTAPHSLIPEHQLNWIREDPRQLHWINNRIKSEPGLKTDELHPFLKGRALTIAALDSRYLEFNGTEFPSEDANARNLLCIRIKTAWEQQAARDRIFDWIKGQDEAAKCAAIIEWLRKNKPERMMTWVAVHALTDVLILFDSTGFNEETIFVIVTKAKKSWSQQQYRKNLKGKKQVNIVLNEKTIKLLDGLSEKFHLTRAEIIDTLIRDEYATRTYLNERIKMREALTQDTISGAQGPSV